MKHVWKILTFSSSLWRYYVAVSLFSISLALLGLLQPLLSGWAIDEIRKGSDAEQSYLLWVVAGIFVIDLGSTLLSNIGGYLGDQMGVKLQRFLSQQYYQHLLRLPQEYFDTELSGKVINRLNRSINQISSFMQMMSNNFLQFIFSTVFSLAIISIYSWRIAVLLFLLYPIYIWLTVRNSNKWQEYQSEKNNHLDIASGRFAEVINQVRVVKSYIQEKRELSSFTKHLDKVVKINVPQSRFWHIQDVKRRVILNVIFLGVYFLIFTQASNGDFTPGQAVTLILYAMQIRIPIFTISFLVENTQRAMADSKDYFEVLDIEEGHESDGEDSKLKVTSGNITFDAVNFSYDDEAPVLKDITLTIPAKTTTALVGESGEGKTTLTNLIMRLYQPQKGSIRIDETDVASVSVDAVRSNVGVVFQDAALFSGTIKENIGYSNPRANQKDIEKAAKAANAHDFISKLAKGYNSEIGERGLKLSGGQKQRIAIARALLKDAPILILDEATSSLDSRSEQLVQSALDNLMKNRTVIIIAHRLSTIQNVDQIITLKNGRVDEIGTPKELASTDGIYANLLRLQSGGYQTNAKELQRYEIKS